MCTRLCVNCRSEHDEHKEDRDVEPEVVREQKRLMQATRGADEPDAVNTRQKRTRKQVKMIDD